jgi:trk system potassium uptake protein TrkA
VNHADVSDEASFIDERMSAYDLAVAVTGNQELNLVTAADAKINGTKRTIALVVRDDYLRIARRMPIDVAVSLKATVVRSILTIIRRGVLRSIQSVGESNLEILEATVDGTAGLAGHAVRDVGRCCPTGRSCCGKGTRSGSSPAARRSSAWRSAS